MTGNDLRTLAGLNIQIGLQLTGTVERYVEGIQGYQTCSIEALAAVVEAISGIFYELSSLGLDSDGYTSCISDGLEGINAVVSETERYLSQCQNLIEQMTTAQSAALPCAGMATDAQTLVVRLKEAVECISVE